MRLAYCIYSVPLLMLALLPAPLAPAGPAANQTPFQVTTVFFVRHAEKQSTPPRDPPLSSSGRTRARSLARILSKAGIKTIFTSQFVRTKETAKPLADAMALAPTVVPMEPDPANPDKVSEQSLRDLVGRIRQHPGEQVLVVGHTNTIPQVIRMLGGDTAPNIPETEFDNLFIVTIFEQDRAKVTQLKY